MINRIPIDNSIIQENIYMLNNYYEGREDRIKYMSIKGKIKFISFEKFKLEKKDIEDIEYDIIPGYLNNILNSTIGKLEIEYTNLNFLTNSDITNKFYLSDENGSNCEIIDKYGGLQAIANHLNVDILDIHGYTFIPKIKTRVNIFYLLQNEGTNYYFGLRNGEIKMI